MASNICGFNLSEVCKAAIDYLSDPDCNLMTSLTAPDFPTGGELIYNGAELAARLRDGARRL